METDPLPKYHYRNTLLFRAGCAFIHLSFEPTGIATNAKIQPMNTKYKLRTLALSALLLSTLTPQLSTVFAQGTAFTYQGRLNDGANPAGGIYDLQFTIYDSAGAGVQQGPTLTNSPTGVTNGLFTVALDFGAGVFTGGDRWLEIGVRTNGGGAFIALSPRQKITPTPYAIMSGNLSGSLAAAALPTGGNWALSSTLTLDASTLAVDPINNRVGIGTSTPATPLTVATGVGISYGIEHTDGTRRLSTYLDGNGCWLGSVSADKLLFYVNNGGSALSIDVAGNVSVDTPATGDNTVNLPADSISAAETGQEPGLAHRRLPGTFVYLNSSWTPTITNSINCPGAGFVLAIFTATVSMASGSVYLDITPTNIDVPSFTHEIFANATAATIHRVFPVAGIGTYSYHTLASANEASGQVRRPHLTLLYVPTAYGSVDP